jgi:ribosomal protein S14
MKYLFIKYKKAVHLFIKFELLRCKYKYIFYNTLLPFFIRSEAFFYLNMYGKSSSLVKIRNVCLFTNKTHSVLSFFHLNRFILKIEQYKGNLNGIRKSTW